MSFLINLIIFLFGLAIGSFLNCVIYRIDKGESFWKGRSYCPNCRHQLSWKDLIPVFSFLALFGKCRYCKKPISLQYPIVEISTAVIFLLIFNFTTPVAEPASLVRYGASLPLVLNFFYLSLVSCFLIIIFVSDLRTYTIPDGAVFGAIAVALIFNFQFFLLRQGFGGQVIFKNSILSGLGAMLFFLFIYLVSKGNWMGFGDVKLAAFMGFFLGWPNIIVAMLLAFFIGAIIGIGLIILGRKKMSSEVPFGPFLVTGTLVSMLIGQKLMDWYLNLFI